MEGNALYTFMTVALLPQKWEPARPAQWTKLPHAEESVQLSIDTLHRYPVDRIMHPVMNSIRTDIEISPFEDRGKAKQAAKPVPIDQRPLDNEYAWKGNPYALDGWLKPTVTSLQFACDDPQVAWFSDANGRAFMTRDGMKTWTDVSRGLLGARVKQLAASPTRTFVVWAETDRGIAVTRDGGMSWLMAGEKEKPSFAVNDPHAWLKAGNVEWRIDEQSQLRHRSGAASMEGWRIPRATWLIATPRGIFAGGPGGAYSTADGTHWTEVNLWRDEESGAADFLHAYWMGRYYGLYN
jgi:hypothetical protein